MKQRLGIFLAILICLLVAAGGVMWANGIIDSLYQYRSPLHSNPPAPGAALGDPLTRQVVFVLVDALRLDTALDGEAMPFLNQLRQQGAWAGMHSRPPSFSQPGYSTLLIGAWPDLNDAPPLNIAEYEKIPTWTQDNLFSAAHRASLKTAIAGYYWFEKLVPQDAVTASHYVEGDEETADRRVTDAALPWVSNPDYQLVLIHYDQVDYAGHHQGGPRDPRWNAAARRVDLLLREIVQKLDFQKDTLLVVSDHGQVDRGGHGGNEVEALSEPFLLVGAGVRPGAYPDVQMVDVAPTLAALLGANLPASTQGRVLVDMLDLTQAQIASIQQAAAVQQAALLHAYQQAIGQEAASEPGSDPVSTYQAAMDDARQARLSAERLPRAILAIILLAITAGLLYLWRRSDLVWMAIGALVYLLVFNFLYLVAGGRTYSLSVLISASDLFLFTGGLALAALAAGWLLVAWKLNLSQRSFAEVGEASFGFILTVIFFLLLPVAWSYVVNGALATWTLPEFGSSFLAFISLFQVLLVVILGLILAGLTVLVLRSTSI